MDKKDLATKVNALISAYEKVPATAKTYPNTLKWSETLKRQLKAGKREDFNAKLIRQTSYRPFVPRWLYQSRLFIDRSSVLETFFPAGSSNAAICLSDVGSRTGTCILAVDGPADLHFGAAIDAYQQVARFRYTKTGERLENVTDWALRLFVKTYGKTGVLEPGRNAEAPPAKGGRRKGMARAITKESIFHYVYAVLYDPVYRETYAANLKREFPRIPFYREFWRWSDWGKELMQLHVGFGSVEAWPLKQVDKLPKQGGLWSSPTVLLRADKTKGVVLIDSETSLTGMPEEVWSYRLGNRSAVEWVLDQHKERKPKDPLIAASFNTYRLSAFKEQVIELIGRVTRVSMETVKITEQMKAAER